MNRNGNSLTGKLIDRPGDILASTLNASALVNIRLQASDYLVLFSLEGVEIAVFAYILVFLCDRYAGGAEQLPILLGP